MFTNRINTRVKILFLLMIIPLLLVIVRVFYIQVFEYKKLNILAKDLWSRNLSIEANRGKIYDRNGNILADNLTTSSLVLIPNQIKDKKLVTEKLSKILGVSYDEMKKHVYKNTSIERVHPEGRRLDFSVADKISSLKFDGVYLVKESKRYYPNGSLFAHGLGYVGIDNQGLAGLELQYDKYLKGKNGCIKYFSDAHSNRLNMSEVYVPAEDGMSITLTIDLDIQKSLEREMDNIRDMFNPDMALAIVADPNSGEILGMSSLPDYDPNNYKKYSSDVLSRNLPIWASYEPGSTFKNVATILVIN